MSKTKIQKNDFIEVEFTGKIKDGDIFDSNIKKDLEKLHEDHDHPVETKPFIFSVGNKMFLDGIDEFLTGKETGKYEIELTPEKAFGKRNPQLIKIIPMRIFKEKNLNPAPGMTFNFDNQMARVLSVSGGRVITDFNNPLAGKNVIYNIKVKKKVEDMTAKVKALMEFLFKKEFKFEIRGSQKKIIVDLSKEDKQLEPIFPLFNDKFKEILGYEIEVKSSSGIKTTNKVEKKPEKKAEPKKEVNKSDSKK